VVDIVLGVSMAPTKVRMVLVEGENADGVTVDQENFDVDVQSSGTAPAQVISAILGTRESAAEGGYHLHASGVTWTDPVAAAALRDALAVHKIENVMLVSAFMSAAALAQAVGNATNYVRTALLFVEPRSATLAVINTDDGSIADVHRKLLPEDDDRAVAELIDLVSGAESLETHPDGVFVVGSGIDIPLIKPALQAATSLTLSVPEEPEMALAQGAALASANSPLFASSTVARAYALDTGADRPQYPIPCVAADNKAGIDNVAYSAVQDEPQDANIDDDMSRRRSMLLVGSSLSVVVISAVVALEIALAMSIRPTVALRPSPNENIIAPTQQAPAPAITPKPEVKPPTPVAEPRAIAPRVVAPAPAPAPAPMPAVPPPVVVPAIPPPVVLPLAPVRAPAPEPPVRAVPRPPVLQPRAPLPPEPQVPRERGLLPRVGEPAPRGPLPGLGGGRAPFGGGLFGRGLFGGGHGFGGFGRR
jgi:hypothetical protein